MTGTTVLMLSYDGSGFAGFARQPGLSTVQGEVEAALQTALRREVLTVGAGRTDAGVHALGQAMSFPSMKADPERRQLIRSLNALTPHAITVTGVRYADPEFSARHSAVSREYRYRIVPGSVPPLFIAPYVWSVPHALDLGAMREAATHIIGEHDFRSFCVAESARGRRTIRRLDVIDVTPEIVLGEHSITVRIVGNAFLHSMVRTIVGSLVEVGVGRHEPGWMAEALGARERAAAGQKAPARGLTLWHVGYPDECWL
ncbi:MAG: tRNA pseudouridine(38-40) synthase TruA [Coriobacteriia bacterium]|nr:tRNA pseudouridine(38-40) synthase TruA [Coriobacteriia bacterium]